MPCTDGTLQLMCETIQEAQEGIVREFARFDDWEERYGAIIAAGRALPDIPDEYKLEKFRVKGCQSTVWLHASMEGGKVVFQATSDAMIVRGLISFLLRVYSGRTPEEIVGTPPDFIGRLGLNAHLTLGRQNGLAAMIEQIKLYAFAFKSIAQVRP